MQIITRITTRWLSSPDSQGILTLDSRDDVGHFPDRMYSIFGGEEQGLEIGWETRADVYIHMDIVYLEHICIYVDVNIYR